MDVKGKEPFKVIAELSLVLVATTRGCVDVEAMICLCASGEMYYGDVVLLSQESTDIGMDYECVRVFERTLHPSL